MQFSERNPALNAFLSLLRATERPMLRRPSYSTLTEPIEAQCTPFLPRRVDCTPCHDPSPGTRGNSNQIVKLFNSLQCAATRTGPGRSPQEPSSTPPSGARPDGLCGVTAKRRSEVLHELQDKKGVLGDEAVDPAHLGISYTSRSWSVWFASVPQAPSPAG